MGEKTLYEVIVYFDYIYIILITKYKNYFPNNIAMKKVNLLEYDQKKYKELQNELENMGVCLNYTQILEKIGYREKTKEEILEEVKKAKEKLFDEYQEVIHGILLQEKLEKRRKEEAIQLRNEIYSMFGINDIEKHLKVLEEIKVKYD